MQPISEQRLDKWLWAARFYKTRALAVDAVKTGKVQVNGVRPKPARLIKVADKVSIRREQFVFDVEVHGLNEQRRPAKEASMLYAETAASQAQRKVVAEQLKVMRDVYQPTARKPDRRQRNAIKKIRRSHI